MHENDVGHENDAGRGRPIPQPFAPRLVRDADQGARGLRAASHSIPRSDPHDPDVREIADSLTDLFLGSSATIPASRHEASGGATVRHTPPDVSRGFAAAGATLGNGRRTESPPVSATATSTVELVVLGHLPVLAGAWLTQYASQAAQSLGRPIALARLEPRGLSIDLFGVPREVAVERRASIGEALDAAGGLVGGWLLRVDELAEAGLAESPRVGALTLLSGVSESSIVAAYRTLKAIVQRAGTPRGVGFAGATGENVEPREEPADLRIALLGATAERAREASARIRKAAATFLGRPVGVIVCAERIGLTSMRSLYRGGFEGDGAHFLEMIADQQRVDGSVEQDPGAGEGPSGGRAEPRPVSESEVKISAVRPDGVAQVGPRMLTNLAAGATPGAVETARAPGVSASARDRESSGSDLEDFLRDEEWLLEPESGEARGEPSDERGGAATTPEPEGTPQSRGAEPGAGATTPTGSMSMEGLAPSTKGAGAESQAGLLGLSGLAIRCPDAPRVELAVDSSCGLHAIVLDEMSAGAGANGVCGDSVGPAGSGRAGVAALLAADAWARANMDLLQRAMPFVRGGEVTLHLLTRVPAAARDLLGTRVKVHLIARAIAAGDVCVGLN